MLIILLTTIAFIIGLRFSIYRSYIRIELPSNYAYGSEHSQKWYYFQFFNSFIIPLLNKFRALIKRLTCSKDTDTFKEIKSVRQLWNFMFNDSTITPGLTVTATKCSVKSENSTTESPEFEVPIYIITPETYDDQ